MPVELFGTLPLGGGLHGKPGANLTTPMRNFLKALVARTNMDVVVTSGVRSPQAQARAWKAKIDLGYDKDAFLRLYKRDDLVEEVFADSDLSVDGMAAVFQKQVERGDHISSHMSGRALDLRVHGYSDDELYRLDTAIKDLGGRVVTESAPPHKHIELRNAKTDRKPRTTTRVASGRRRRTR
jgi:hypothetical protein